MVSFSCDVLARSIVFQAKVIGLILRTDATLLRLTATPRPILVAAKLESMITAIVGEIGSSKDQIEPLNYLNEVLESGRLSPEVQKRVAAKLQDLKSQASDELKLVHDLQSRITATQLLEEIVRFLKMFNQTSPIN